MIQVYGFTDPIEKFTKEHTAAAVSLNKTIKKLKRALDKESRKYFKYYITNLYNAVNHVQNVTM
ncbi:35607_t:CDS:1, partial [Racocetra persica]